MLEKTGIPTAEHIESATPSQERRAKGAVAVVECFQSIPCNPCYTYCRRGAMKELTDINDRPAIDVEKCNGCGICVSRCPGLAIFVIDESYSDTEALVKIPYEFSPLPEAGDYVTGLDRSGKSVCRAKVIQVLSGKAQDKTAVISLAVPKELSMTVRNIKVEDEFGDNTMICRCEELTLGELREYIRNGCTTIDEIKRLSRAGMGACQGRTCRQLIMQELAKATGTAPADMTMPTFRPPVKPVRLGFLCGDENDE